MAFNRANQQGLVIDLLKPPYRLGEMRWQARSWSVVEWRVEGRKKRWPTTHRKINTTWWVCGNGAAALCSRSGLSYKPTVLPHGTCDVIRKNISQWHRPFVFTGRVFDHVVFHTAHRESVFLTAHHCKWYRGHKMQCGPQTKPFHTPQYGVPPHRDGDITHLWFV